MADRHSATATHFDLAVDHTVYRPRAVQRRDDTVVLYARDSTPRRAVALGKLALEELHRRRPATRIVLFGGDREHQTRYPRREPWRDIAGCGCPSCTRRPRSGLSLSLTNYSLIPQEMLACGLPCVELAGRSVEHEFGRDGPIALAPPDPIALAGAIERLLDDPAERERRSRAGIELVAGRTWERATEQVEDGLRTARLAGGTEARARSPPAVRATGAHSTRGRSRSTVPGSGRRPSACSHALTATTSRRSWMRWIRSRGPG